MGRVNRYNVRIDGQVAPRSFTYEELLINDFLELDDIEIQKVGTKNWTIVTAYYFPEEHDNEKQKTDEQDYFVDESGQAHFKRKMQSNGKESPDYKIDEYGQVVRSDYARPSSKSSSSSRSSPSSSPTPKPDNNTGWKILGSIVVIAIAILIGLTGWIGTAGAACGAIFCLRQIWADS